MLKLKDYQSYKEQVELELKQSTMSMLAHQSLLDWVDAEIALIEETKKDVKK